MKSAAHAPIALLLLLLISACGGPPIDCDVRVIAQTDLMVRNRLLLVKAGIAGQWVTLLVDTGAERTTLSEEAAARLNLPRDRDYHTASSGMGGSQKANDAIIPALVLGGKNIPLYRIGVTPLRLGPDMHVDGLLGADILLGHVADTDIDVPGRKLTLYHARVCPDVTPPWTEPGAEVTGVSAINDRLLVPIEVDHVKGMGFLDTGAQATVLGRKMAQRLNLTDRDMAGDMVVKHRGAGAGETASRLHQFHFLRIGPAQATQPLLSVLSTDIGRGADALVGEDFINGRRIWMSYTSKTVFISTTPPPELVPDFTP